MKIQFLNGGLANQVFQYIFYRFGELTNPKDLWYLDDSFFYATKIHNGYELEKVFGLQPKLISGLFDEDIWDNIMEFRRQGYDIPSIFTEAGTPIDLKIAEARFPYEHPFEGPTLELECNGFEPGITKIEGLNIYYHGYWINKKWFQQFKEIFLEELKFPPILDVKNLEYYQMILNSESVGIHVRRGDYVSHGLTINSEFYLDACQKFLKIKPNATFFVFSDDLEWCKQNQKALGFNLAKETVYVEGNHHENSYVDLQLLTYCRNLIMSNSAFCYLAALLNQRLDSYINSTMREI